MNKFNILLLCLIFWNVEYVECNRVLIICPALTLSHQILCNGVVDTLVDNANRVTVINSYPSKNTNINQIVIPFHTIIDEETNGFNYANTSHRPMMKSLTEWPYKIAETLFTNEDVIKILNDKSATFDLVIYEYMMNEMLTGLGVHFDCPVMILSADLLPWIATMTGNPLSLATVTNPMVTYTQTMTLYERTVNTILYIIQEIVGKILLEPIQKELYEKYMPKEAELVPYGELKHKVSMVVTNTHPSVDVARPLLPNVVEIGGYHIGQPEPLPKDLKDIMDSAKHGVIYFSMGSILKSSQMDEAKKVAILKVFSTLKQTILWKFEEDLPEKPDNVIIRKWMPQWSILAHSNVKLFISHGGLLSCTEAIHFGVPMLALPVFADQPYNAKRMSDRSQGVTLAYDDIDEDTFARAIEEVLENSTYAETAKKINTLFHDRLMSPRDVLAFNVIHIIATKGAKHLSQPVLPRHSQLLLDVFAVILIPTFIILHMSIFTCRKLCCKRKGAKTKTE